MNGPIAQIVALTCHGNAAVRGLELPRFFPDNSTAQFCERISFVKAQRTFLGKVKETVLAETPDRWFEYLRARGARALKLGYGSAGDGLEDHQTAAFAGGGGSWSISVALPTKTSVWVDRWEVWNRDAPDRRIWRVTYGRVGQTDMGMTIPAPDLSSAAGHLRRALLETAPFARRHDSELFAGCFEKAVTILETGEQQDGYHEDLAPKRALPERRSRSSRPVRRLGSSEGWGRGTT